jgi:hypothetical protein
MADAHGVPMSTTGGQRAWQRITLLLVLGYEGLGALVGGSLLVARPDGRYMDLPIAIMRGAFRDFLLPGAILCGLGLLSLAAFVGVLRRWRADWIGAGLALGGWAVWFFVEIAILQELHWLHVMWGFPVILGMVVAVPLLPFRPATMKEAWLLCGIASSWLYVAMNVIASMQWPAYSSASQMVSELSAVGAPTRPLWVVMAVVYTLLVTGFGWGVRMAAAGDRRLRVVGTLVVIYGALGFVWLFAPMHMRQALAAGGGTFSDKLHIALATVTVAIYLGALLFAAAAFGRAFRLFSVASLAVLLVFAGLTFREAPAVGANQPTPLMGVWERINIGIFLLWVIVLAIALLARDRSREQARGPADKGASGTRRVAADLA